ncbi:MAG: divalent-cation tolerance protein CutA [Thermoplasmata archaeon]|nr:divalent-cation tolerance protein CutA [Thermoplasmata archaeon]
MSPYPLDPVAATGPLRLVLCAFPTEDSARSAADSAVGARLAACASRWPIDSTFWWKEKVERSAEVLVLFKTAPKHVGALFRHLSELHPYEVPEILEIDVPRVHEPYLRYVAATIDPHAPPLPWGGGRVRPTRRGSPKVRGAPRPARTRAPRRRR